MENLLMGDINNAGPSDGKTLLFPLSSSAAFITHCLVCLLMFVPVVPIGLSALYGQASFFKFPLIQFLWLEDSGFSRNVYWIEIELSHLSYMQ